MSKENITAQLANFRAHADQHRRREVFEKISLAFISRNGNFSTAVVELLAERLLENCESFAVRDTKKENSSVGEENAADEKRQEGQEEL